MAQTLEAVDAKANIILQKKGDDALLFIPGAVSKFVIAHGYDEETCTWSHGSYFSNLTAASMEFSPAETRPDERTEAIEHIENLMDKIDDLDAGMATTAPLNISISSSRLSKSPSRRIGVMRRT